MIMKIASWNVNSLNVRLPHLLEWLKIGNPDVLVLQETKLEDHKFPQAEIEAAGYHVVFDGQKTYNGVAILAREPVEDVAYGIPGFDDPQRRVIAATVGARNSKISSAVVRNTCSTGSNHAWHGKLKNAKPAKKPRKRASSSTIWPFRTRFWKASGPMKSNLGTAQWPCSGLHWWQNGPLATG